MNADLSGNLVSSYDLDRLYRDGLVENPANLPQVNYILNTFWNKPGYSKDEVQTAIWVLAENKPVIPGSKVEQMVKKAEESGTNYAPTCDSDWFAAILVPKVDGVIKNQIIFVALQPKNILEICTAK